MSKAYNVRMSDEAIAHVRRRLPLGAVNKGQPADGAMSAFSLIRANEAMRPDRNQAFAMRLASIAANATAEGAGNCGEMSVLAFRWLRQRFVPRLELVSGRTDREYYDGRPSDHGFIIIGRRNGSALNNPATWGNQAVICDPWLDMTIDDPVAYWADMFDNSWAFNVDVATGAATRAAESPI